MADFTPQVCVGPDSLRPLWYAGLAGILPRQRGKMDLCCLMRIGLSGAVAGPRPGHPGQSETGCVLWLGGP